MPALSAGSLEKFYAEMICAYMENLSSHSGTDQMVDVQTAIGLSDDEFEMGLRWCVEHGIITFAQQNTERH